MIFDVIQNASTLAPTNRASNDIDVWLSSAVLDLQLGAKGSGSGFTYPTHVKVYHLKCRKNVVAEPTLLFPQGIAEKAANYTLPGTTALINPLSPDTSPFDSGLLCRNFIIKHCTEHVIGPVQSIDLQLRDRREYKINLNELSSQSLATSGFPSLRKCTQGFFVLWQGGLDIQAGGGSLGAATLEYNASANIRFSCPQLQIATAVQAVAYP